MPHQSKNDSENRQKSEADSGTKKRNAISIIFKIKKKFLIRNCRIRTCVSAIVVTPGGANSPRKK
uniref:Uncharacterized protein n=1 Tax=Meloidogyne enterolobii TaxID=390850 RepID=A0A6V7XMP4_MELEN|nr:unnamed protein product [Meloidogyne enterolobii]